MHRHGTLNGRWKALAFGAVVFLVGYGLGHLGWSGLLGGTPRPPTGGEATLIVAGSAFMLLGAILGLTPHVLWLMRSFYKEDFAAGAVCPVMLVCGSCATYNPRARPHCKKCAASLVGARAAGGNMDLELA